MVGCIWCNNGGTDDSTIVDGDNCVGSNFCVESIASSAPSFNGSSLSQGNAVESIVERSYDASSSELASDDLDISNLKCPSLVEETAAAAAAAVGRGPFNKWP